MVITKLIVELKKHIDLFYKDNKIIGFVPTMGALHEGHLSLIREAKKQSDIVLVSIFVNPTQFNNRYDFEKYPRLYNRDIEILENSGLCDFLFMPDEKEMYPQPDNRTFNLGYLEEIMEGKYRPGHFQGVVKIVSKLFDIIKPNKAFFGKKDFQQLTIIKKIVKDFKYPIEIIGCETVRESNNLAMSSRNLLLTKEEFEKASIIYQTLKKVADWIHQYEIDEIKTLVINEINSVNPFQVEYVELVDSETLKPIEDINLHSSIHCFIAVFCNQVRLIDNIEIKL